MLPGVCSSLVYLPVRRIPNRAFNPFCPCDVHGWRLGRFCPFSRVLYAHVFEVTNSAFFVSRLIFIFDNG